MSQRSRVILNSARSANSAVVPAVQGGHGVHCAVRTLEEPCGQPVRRDYELL